MHFDFDRDIFGLYLKLPHREFSLDKHLGRPDRGFGKFRTGLLRRDTQNSTRPLASTFLDGSAVGLVLLDAVKANLMWAVPALVSAGILYVHRQKWLAERREKLKSEIMSARSNGILCSMKDIVQAVKRDGTRIIVHNEILWRTADEARRFIENGRRILRSPREWRRILTPEEREIVAEFVEVLRMLRRELDEAMKELPRPYGRARIALW